MLFGVVNYLLRETLGAAAQMLLRPATSQDVRRIVREEIEDFERRTAVLITTEDEKVKS